MAGEGHLVESRWQLKGLKSETCGFQIMAEGFGPGQMVWSVAPGMGFEISAGRAGRVLWKSVVTADGNGRLTVAPDINAIEPVELRFLCHDR